MNQYQVRIKNSAKNDLKKSNLKESFMKVLSILKEDPYKPTQTFEKLQPKSAGHYSLRLNNQHRVVYTVNDETKTVDICSAWTHYK